MDEKDAQRYAEIYMSTFIDTIPDGTPITPGLKQEMKDGLELVLTDEPMEHELKHPNIGELETAQYGDIYVQIGYIHIGGPHHPTKIRRGTHSENILLYLLENVGREFKSGYTDEIGEDGFRIHFDDLDGLSKSSNPWSVMRGLAPRINGYSKVYELIVKTDSAVLLLKDQLEPKYIK